MASAKDNLDAGRVAWESPSQVPPCLHTHAHVTSVVLSHLSELFFVQPTIPLPDSPSIELDPKIYAHAVCDNFAASSLCAVATELRRYTTTW